MENEQDKTAKLATLLGYAIRDVEDAKDCGKEALQTAELRLVDAKQQAEEQANKFEKEDFTRNMLIQRTLKLMSAQWGAGRLSEHVYKFKGNIYNYSICFPKQICELGAELRNSTVPVEQRYTLQLIIKASRTDDKLRKAIIKAYAEFNRNEYAKYSSTWWSRFCSEDDVYNLGLAIREAILAAAKPTISDELEIAKTLEDDAVNATASAFEKCGLMVSSTDEIKTFTKLGGPRYQG